MRSPAQAIQRTVILLAVLTAGGLTPAGGQNTLRMKVESGEPQWIWSPEHTKDQVPAGVAYFRKSFDVGSVEQANLQIACDDKFELFVNGRLAGSGTDWKKLQSFDIQKYLQAGHNAIAVRAENTTGETAGLVVRLTIRQKGNTSISYSSDVTWKTSDEETPNWEKLNFDDTEWAVTQSFGELGQATPWADQVRATDGAQATRFTIAPEFRVERIVGPDKAKSLIAMTFNEFGDILASREGGPLILISDKDRDGLPEKVDVYSDKVKSCQGILALNGHVFAVGDGPDGPGLYRLEDTDHDRHADDVHTMFQFKGPLGEHGPHAVVLGPDGLLYVMVGNHTHCLKEPEANSPHHHWYEGDLVQPKYEDPGGHAVGIKAPGGVVLRTDTEGSFVQTYAGGFRNAYDIAFNRQGDLFTFDSDMEWDEGLTWYRPTRINHVTAGGEYGWRSGWSNWFENFYDSLPATLNVGRGSPTGMVVYNHYMMPLRYHNALFACDWSQGRILAVKLKPDGGTYEAVSEVFLQGTPLNVTDIEVGPDGWLYFSTGGRDTDGGIYRVVWTGKVPPRAATKGIAAAIMQPQPDSAWGRQKIALVQQQLGDDWGPQLSGIAANAKNKPEDRAKALDLMQLFGPFPTSELLVKLAGDRNSEVRAKTAQMMGLHVDDATGAAIVRLLTDADATVRRTACESLTRSGREVPAEKVIPLLADPNRFVAYAARRAIQALPPEKWQPLVLKSNNLRVFLVGSAALLAIDTDEDLPRTILDRASNEIKGQMGDDDFRDLLRLIDLALQHGTVKADDIPELAQQLDDEYPSRDPLMNRELVRLLAYLQRSEILPRLLVELKSDAPWPERVHAAAFARAIESGWTTEQKLTLLEFYEQSRAQPGGHSYPLYLDGFTRDFVAKFNDEEKQALLLQGDRAPGAALIVLAGLNEKLDSDAIAELIALDGKLQKLTTTSGQTLRTGIVAVLGRSRDPQGMAYLRERFELEPNRRHEIAMGLAQDPGGDNWPVLLRALPVLEGNSAREVLKQLASTDLKPEQPEPIRQAILSGLRLGENGGLDAAKLLSRWTDHTPESTDDKAEAVLGAWQQWFAQQYPDLPAAALPVEPPDNKWSFAELTTFLASEPGTHGDAQRGAAIFERAQCVKCHRYGTRGEAIGPDLTTVSQRFQKKEIIESVISPSQVISDQYASKTVVTDAGKTYTGIVGQAGAGTVVVLQPSGEKVSIPRDSIAEIVPNPKSAMPEGLFNTLTLDEIADLFTFLATPPPSPGAASAGREAPKKQRPATTLQR